MLKYERQQEILKILKEKHSCSVKELAGQIYTSEASVRRDIEVLEQRGYVHKIYGAVVLAEYRNEIVPVDLRDGSNSAVKEQLAKRAADLVFDGAVIIMDSSSTVRRMCKYLDRFYNLKIITNNLRIFSEMQNKTCSLYCTGGNYHANNNVFLGTSAEGYLRGIHADLVFFSSQGISEEGDVTDVSEEETSIRRVMLERAEKKVFLCDSSKIGVKKMFRLCGKDQIDLILSDVPMPWEV